MSPSDEQAQLREHLSELRRAARGLGKDVEIKLTELGENIERLPSLTARGAREQLLNIHDDFAAAGRLIDQELSRLPKEIHDGLTTAGQRIGAGATRLAGATRDGLEAVGQRTRQGTKNVLAAAAGVRRTPIKAWHPPASDEPDEPK